MENYKKQIQSVRIELEELDRLSWKHTDVWLSA